MSDQRCFKVNPADNVATMLDDGAPGPAEILGDLNSSFSLVEPVQLAHKVAIREIKTGQPVIKFGIPIGRASTSIRAGQWVHLHNCSSSFDERSQTLDVHTGAVTDTKYE